MMTYKCCKRPTRPRETGDVWEVEDSICVEMLPNDLVRGLSGEVETLYFTISPSRVAKVRDSMMDCEMRARSKGSP